MSKIKELTKLKEEYIKSVTLRNHGEDHSNAVHKKQILVCGGTGCIASESKVLVTELEKHLEANGIDSVNVITTGCFGLCAQGPIVIVYPEGTFYSLVTPEDAKEIVEVDIVGNKKVERLMYVDLKSEAIIDSLWDTPFYGKQERVSLRNCGRIDPRNINEYIAYDGYRALGQVISENDADKVIDIIGKAGLRGRGGAGFPTSRKWSFTKAAESDQKYVVCNADEGDPGAFMDRSIIEGDPHVLIEAMSIAAFCIGADEGYVYIRAEYPIAVERLQFAIEQAKERNFLGKNVMGTNFNFALHIVLGAGAFVCGEETALLNSIEGHRGEPRPRPPFPAVKGLFGMPTLINNVETYSNIPQIILNGSEWFASKGTETSKGTKVFALGGNIEHTGLVEIPMGTTLREVVEDIGGGIPNGKKFKAAQTGGPSGGCIPAQFYDTPIDYENLIALGSMMGSGGLIVMDEDTCMVDIAKFFLEFTVDESCGKCLPCRVGTKRLLEILEKITQGTAKMADLDKMEELCKHIQDNSLCGLGQGAPQPVVSTFKYFKDEYLAHVMDRHCPAGVCKELLTYKIIEDKCIGCTLCARNCPVNAISGELRAVHHIDTDICIKCGVCIGKCKPQAIIIE